MRHALSSDLRNWTLGDIEVCALKGLVTYYILFFIDIASRSVHIAGITPHPTTDRMVQIARNSTDEDGFLRGKRYLILDREAKYCDEFRRALGRGASRSFDCRQNPLI